MNSLLNHLMLRLVLIGLVCAGIALYCIDSVRKSKRQTAGSPAEQADQPSVKNEEPRTFTAGSSDTFSPAYVRSQSDLPLTIQANIPHVSHEKSIVVFRNGTSLFIDNEVENPIEQALEELRNLKGKEIKFAVHRVENGNILVSFAGGHFFQWVFHKEARMMHSQKLESVRSLLGEAEHARIPKDWKPSLEAKTGLLARSWLKADIASPEVIKVLKAAPTKDAKSTSSADASPS